MDELQVSIRSRRLYGSSVMPRAFAEVHATAKGGAPASFDLFGRSLTAMAGLPVTVGGRRSTLAAAGPALASYYRSATTSAQFTDAHVSWLVSAERPLFLVTSPEIVNLQPEASGEWKSVRKEPGLYCRLGASYAAWLVTEPDHNRRLRLRQHIVRIHIEKATFIAMMRAVVMSRLHQSEKATIDTSADEFGRTLHECSSFIGRQFAYGSSQAGLLEAMDADEWVNGDEWSSIREALGDLEGGVRKAAQNAAGIVNNVNVEVNMGDSFKNISGTFINRSVVTNSLNKVSASGEKELAEALSQILSAVQESGNAEASELTAELIDGVSAGKSKVVLTAIWDRVKSIAPVVGSLVGAAGVVARFLGAS